MKPKQVWMAIVFNGREVLFNKICQSEESAEKEIVGYLKNTTGFDGDNIEQAEFWIGEKLLPLSLMVFAVQPEAFNDIPSLAPLTISPPPGREWIFRVVYVIDVGAGNVVEAAETAHQMMTSTDSIPPIVEVIDNRGNKVRIDLSIRLGKGQQCLTKSMKPSKRC